MNARRKLALVAAVVGALALTGSGTALAGGLSTAHQASAARSACPGGAAGDRGLLSDAAGYLGLTVDQVRSALAGGSSLATLATSHGKTVAGLKAALRAAYVQRLDAKVAAGKLTSTQEQQLLSSFDAKIDAVLNKTGSQGSGSFQRRR